MTELIQAIASPGCALPDSKQASAALSFQLGTWCKHCWSTTIRICIIFESFTASAHVHAEELQASFTFSVSFLLLFVYFETIKAGNLITYVLYVLWSNEGKWKNSIFCGKLEVCQNLLSWSWEDWCCTSVKEINHLGLKIWIKEFLSQHFTANLIWTTRANYLIVLQLPLRTRFPCQSVPKGAL